MKVKNLEIGLRVQVKPEGHKYFYKTSAGEFGTIVAIDVPSDFDVKVQYDDGGSEWGNHKGIKQVKTEPADIKVGDRVRLKSNDMLGFLAGDVGTVKHIATDGAAAVYFDVARNGWRDQEYGIPDLHGLWVGSENLEVITD